MDNNIINNDENNADNAEGWPCLFRDRHSVLFPCNSRCGHAFNLTLKARSPPNGYCLGWRLAMKLWQALKCRGKTKKSKKLAWWRPSKQTGTDGETEELGIFNYIYFILQYDSVKWFEQRLFLRKCPPKAQDITVTGALEWTGARRKTKKWNFRTNGI